jgi:hypothetical protein
MMDRWEGYVQVLTLANPLIEVVAPPTASPYLAPQLTLAVAFYEEKPQQMLGS